MNVSPHASPIEDHINAMYGLLKVVAKGVCAGAAVKVNGAALVSKYVPSLPAAISAGFDMHANMLAALGVLPPGLLAEFGTNIQSVGAVTLSNFDSEETCFDKGTAFTLMAVGNAAVDYAGRTGVAFADLSRIRPDGLVAARNYYRSFIRDAVAMSSAAAGKNR